MYICSAKSSRHCITIFLSLITSDISKGPVNCLTFLFWDQINTSDNHHYQTAEVLDVIILFLSVLCFCQILW
jgi:hypothetical protein